MQFYIKEARELAGYSQKELAEIVGVAPNTFHGYESGKHDPKSALLVKIASACHVSVDYLLTGKMTGEWIALSGKQNAPSDVSEEAKKVAIGFDKLDKRGQRVVQAVLDCEGNPVPEEPKKPTQAITALPKAKRRSDGFTELRVYEQPAAAGLGNYLDEPPFHMEQYPEDVVPEKADFGIVISGDSMEPEIHNGGTVFVQSSPTIDPGQIGIFVLDGKAYCKMLSVNHDRRQVRLLSVNPAYDPIPVGPNADFWTLGCVLGQWTPGIDRYEP